MSALWNYFWAKYDKEEVSKQVQEAVDATSETTKKTEELVSKLHVCVLDYFWQVRNIVCFFFFIYLFIYLIGQ